jgi:hypothetical protein
MKIDVGLIGKGKWGLNIKNSLNKISNLRFIIGKNDDFLSMISKNNIKWIFIATPNITHYVIVKKCLQKGLNVFCEKPLCLSSLKAKNLIDIAKKKNLKLYVSDLYDFYSNKKIKFKLENNVYRSKLVNGKDSEFFNRFMYHDVSIFYKFLKNNPFKKAIINSNKKNKFYNIEIMFKKKQVIKFKYNLSLKTKIHTINNCHIKSKKNLLTEMIYNVLNNKVNFDENNLKAIFIIKFLETIKKKSLHNY